MELKKIGLLLAKIEGTYNVDPTPTVTANAIATTRDAVTFSPKCTEVARMILDGGLAQIPGSISQKRVEIKFQTELRGNRTDGTAADISSGSISNLLREDCLFQACNLAATYTAETVATKDGYVTYNPTIPATVGPSVTFWFYSKLKKHIITGCKGTFTIDWSAGKFGMINWTFTGMYTAIADVTFPTTQSFVTIKPPLVLGASATWGAYAAIWRKATFDLGNVVSMCEDATAADGIGRFMITDRASKFDFDPDAVAEATNPFWADWAAQTVKTMTVPIGTFTGNKQTTTLIVQNIDPTYGDHNGQIIHQAKCKCVQSALGDTLGSEVALKFF